MIDKSFGKYLAQITSRLKENGQSLAKYDYCLMVYEDQQKEVERLIIEHEQVKTVLNNCIADLNKKIEILTECAEFYLDESHWKKQNQTNHTIISALDIRKGSRLYRVGGRTAHEALSQVEKLKDLGGI